MEMFSSLNKRKWGCSKSPLKLSSLHFIKFSVCKCLICVFEVLLLAAEFKVRTNLMFFMYFIHTNVSGNP